MKIIRKMFWYEVEIKGRLEEKIFFSKKKAHEYGVKKLEELNDAMIMRNKWIALPKYKIFRDGNGLFWVCEKDEHLFKYKPEKKPYRKIHKLGLRSRLDAKSFIKSIKNSEILTEIE